jgi:anti-anti-sigma factor
MNVTAPGDPSPPEGALFGVDTDYAGRCAYLALRGELDIATVRVLDEELRVVWARDIRRIEIDLRHLTFIGSSGVAALLVRGPAAVQRIFELTGIESQFAFRPASARRDERAARSGPLGIVS